MIRKIAINQYRRLKNLNIDFSAGINLIAGANGTCKSSLLHIVSNSFQKLTISSAPVTDKKCLSVIKGINTNLNPKIESLTRGDKKYRDPAIGVKGTLYTVEYFNGSVLSFRKHNSEIQSRYSIKPQYSSGTEDKLPELPVIYLGLSRLYPFGEYQNDDAITRITYDLPEQLKEEIKKIYKDLTRIDIATSAPQEMKDIKVRTEFDSEQEGVDSNTISSGEENIYIILTALVSLQYYYSMLKEDSKDGIKSVLLIDELDATLHPALQIKILNLMRQYATDYHIQIVATTHSLSLLEYALRHVDNIIYLMDNITNLKVMENPDIYKIKMDLKTIARQDIYAGKKIPIFTEDAEARSFLNKLLDYGEKNIPGFRYVRNCFYLVDANLGCDNLRQIFSDSNLRPLMQAICILDGDQTANKGSHIISLPGGLSPEKLLLNYADKIYDADDPFWYTEEVYYHGLRKPYFAEHIQAEYHKKEDELKKEADSGADIKGKRRKVLKKIWNDFPEFFELISRHWIHDSSNLKMITSFFDELRIQFYKTAEFHGINRDDWKEDTEHE